MYKLKGQDVSCWQESNCLDLSKGYSSGIKPNLAIRYRC